MTNRFHWNGLITNFPVNGQTIGNVMSEEISSSFINSMEKELAPLSNL